MTDFVQHNFRLEFTIKYLNAFLIVHVLPKFKMYF